MKKEDEKSSGKRWTAEETGIVKSNWNSSLGVGENVKILAPLLPNRTLEAIKREMYDFRNRGIIQIKSK